MNLNEVQAILEKIGIKLVISEQGELKCFDIENNVEMDTKLYAPYLPNDRKLSAMGTPLVNSLPEVIQQKNSIVAHSPFLGVSFSLIHPIVNGKTIEEKIALSDIGYFRKTQGLGSDISIMWGGTGMEIINKNDKVPDEDSSEIESKITINGNINEIVVGKNSKYGCFYEGEYDLENSDFTYDEIVDIIKESELLNLVSDYYSNLYPNLAPALQTLSNVRNSGLKM